MNKLKKFIQYFFPPDKWKLPVIILLGIFTGLGIFIFHISNATSYLSDKPETCINCHVMFPNYDSWQNSSHGRVTTCNDCHVPHNNFVSKYFFKAKDGSRHATMFTLRLEPQVIKIKEAGAEVVQENCERCHENLLSHVDLLHNQMNLDDKDEVRCWTCHRDVPHGRTNSLSSAPNALLPKQQPVMPEWMQKIFGK